jgi:hypothetical protein
VKFISDTQVHCAQLYTNINIVEGHRHLHLTIQYKLFPWIGFAAKETVFFTFPLFSFFLGFLSKPKCQAQMSAG